MAVKTKERPVRKQSARGHPEVVGKKISIDAEKPGKHENAEGITADTVWRVSPDRSSVNLLSLLGLSRGSGVYVKLQVDDLNLPASARQRLEEGGEADEAAVFLSTRMGNASVEAMLALRYSEQWREVARWRSRWADLGISRNEVCVV